MSQELNLLYVERQLEQYWLKEIKELNKHIGTKLPHWICFRVRSASELK